MKLVIVKLIQMRKKRLPVYVKARGWTGTCFFAKVLIVCKKRKRTGGSTHLVLGLLNLSSTVLLNSTSLGFAKNVDKLT